MQDCFATLQLPRSLRLETGEIESAWQALARKAGQDGSESGPADLAESLHEARRILLDPVSRLEHWLSLRGDERPRGSAMDASLMDLFGDLGSSLAGADSVLARHAKAATALSRALLASATLTAQLDLQERLREVNVAIEARTSRFPEIEASLPDGGAELAFEFLGQLKFLRKWERQVQERLLALIAL